jgi:hypothetical protein
VPQGWRNNEDLPGNFQLYRSKDPQGGVVGGNYLGIYQNARAAAINCDEAPQAGVGAGPQDLVAWYRSVPGLIVSAPTEVTVGGLKGYQIDLALQHDDKTCRYDQYFGIPLIIGNGVSALHHVILHEHDVRLVILAWQGGNVTLEITSIKDAIPAADYRAALAPILDSIQFTTP